MFFFGTDTKVELQQTQKSWPQFVWGVDKPCTASFRPQPHWLHWALFIQWTHITEAIATGGEQTAGPPLSHIYYCLSPGHILELRPAAPAPGRQPTRIPAAWNSAALTQAGSHIPAWKPLGLWLQLTLAHRVGQKSWGWNYFDCIFQPLDHFFRIWCNGNKKIKIKT